MAELKYIKRTVALDGSDVMDPSPNSFFDGEKAAHTFIITATRGGEALMLTGAVSATFLNPHDAVVPVTGSIVDGAAVVTLNNDCYALSGPFTLTIDVAGVTVYACRSRVRRRSSSTAYDPSGEISVAQIAAMIAEMRTATAAANTAAAEADAARESMQGTIQNHIYGAFGHGANYYNYKAVNTGYVLRADGTQSIIATGYTSDFIPVEANTVYNKRYIFNSSTIADVTFYDANKAFLSAFYGSGTVKYFTTPANCAYIRICGYTSDIKSEFIYKGQNARSHEYYQEILLPSAGGGDIAYLFAQSKIVFDSTNNQLVTIFGSGNIYLHIPGLQASTLYPPVAVSGSGNTLYYNKDTNSFYRSNDDVINNPAVFRLGILGQEQTRSFPTATMDGMYFVANRPLLLYDVANSALSVRVKSGTYIWYNKTYGALTAEEYDLPLLRGGINCVYFNLATKKFVIANDFGAYGSRPDFAPIGFIYGPHVSLSVPFAVLAGEGSQCGKTALTYGDSLTWYDGHAFTWGPHQGEICRGFQTYLANILGIACTNRGASGSTTPQIVADILNDASRIASVDYVILMPSIMNDDRLSVSPGTVQNIGGTFDAATTAGALQTAIEYIYSVQPGVRIVMIVEPMGFTYRDGAPHLCNEQLPATIRSVAALYGIPCIDLWAKSGINALTRNTYYADPPFESGNTDYMYHPNNLGWEKLSRLICAEIKKY